MLSSTGGGISSFDETLTVDVSDVGFGTSVGRDLWQMEGCTGTSRGLDKVGETATKVLATDVVSRGSSESSENSESDSFTINSLVLT